MRSIRFALAATAAILLTVGVGSPAGAGVLAQLGVQDYAFTPGPPTPYVGLLGSAVHWHNVGPSTHEPAQDARLALWNTGPVAAGSDSRNVTLFAAGTFRYHCAIHPFMKATIQVPVTTDISSGGVGDTVTIRVTSRASHPRFTFNVQRRIDGGTWATFRKGVTGVSVTYKVGRTGTYQFRAQIVRTTTHGASLWSPFATVTIS